METTPRRPVLFLPFWVWVLLAAAIGVGFVQTQLPDQGMANAVTWPVLVVTALLLLLWFSFFSGRPRHVRYEVFAAAIVLAGLFALLFRVEGMTGNMIPILALRFSPRPHTQADTMPQAGETKADLATATPHDFPQFLGPNRDLSVPGVKLARAWSARPPEEVWRKQVGDGWSGFAAVNGYAVTLEQRGNTEAITCYEISTGKLMWSHGHEARYETFIAGIGPRSTPTIHQGKVYALGGTGILFCLDGASGQPIWQKNLLEVAGLSAEREAEQLYFGRASSPLIVDELVVVPLGGPPEARSSLAAFHKDTGALVWKGGERNVSYSSPAFAALAGIPHILIVNEDYAGGHDPATGKVLWEISWPGNSSKDANVSQAVPVQPDRVYISKGYGAGSTLLKLVPKADGTIEPQTLWRQKFTMKSKFTNVTIKDGYVYGLSDGILECQQLETGKRIWRDGRYGHGQILRVDDLLLVLGEEGELTLVEASPENANNVLGQVQALQGRTWNNLALYGEHLLARNGDEAVCYRLALAE